jgi:hypothetical protein
MVMLPARWLMGYYTIVVFQQFRARKFCPVQKMFLMMMMKGYVLAHTLRLFDQG